MISLSYSGIAKRLYEINSPLPRLIEYRYPLAGEWIHDKHERPLTAFSFVL